MQGLTPLNGRLYRRLAAAILLILIAGQLLWGFHLLKRSDGRHAYHVDCVYRVMNAYKWSRAPFFTWDPARLPLESWIYGGALMVWSRIWLALPAVNLLLAAAGGLLAYRLGRNLAGDRRAALLAAALGFFIPDYLLAAVGVMGEIILATILLAGFLLWLDYRRTAKLPRLYSAAVLFLLASAVRPEGWLYVAVFGGLLFFAAFEKGARPERRKHLLAAGAIAAAFIPVFLVHSATTTGRVYYFMQHYYDGLPISGDRVLVWGNVPLPFVTPRLLRYPYFLFRLQPLLVVLGAAGAALLLAGKRRAGKEYVCFLLAAFLLHSLKAGLVGTSYTPARTMLFFALGSVPLAAVVLGKLFRIRTALGWAAAALVAGQIGLNFSEASGRVEHYRNWIGHTGRIDRAARKVLLIDSYSGFLRRGVNVLAEVDALDPIPSEYNLFYYFPENLAFDRASHVSYKTRKDLFVRSFDQTYLGRGEERIEPRGPSLFELDETALKEVLTEHNVGVVITHTGESTRKLESLTGRKPIEVHKYRIFLLSPGPESGIL